MQQVCLETCFHTGLHERPDTPVAHSLDRGAQTTILERAASATNFRPVVEAIHRGPLRRGNPRRIYALANGGTGDAYSCVLHAVASHPPALSFKYQDLMQRIT